MSRRTASVSLLFITLFLSSSSAADPKGGPPEFKHLEFRNIGPAAGGRVCRACGVPGDPLTYYAATSAGGVWKSVDGGVTWKPIFDDQPCATIGSIAVAASDPNVVYVGTGEANIRGNVQVGNGIYKSGDGGKTWKHVWKQEGQIGTLLIHPTNPDVAFAAVLGHAFGPNPERGVYRTTDGGRTWKAVLTRDADTGASDVCFDPSNPRVLFAGLWQVRRKPWELTSGGPGSGLYVSRDGGDTWTQLLAPPAPESPDAGKDAPAGKSYADGLPEGIWGKVCVAVAPSDGRRVYAMIEAEKGGLFRSDDGGDTWKLANDAHALRQRAWYFSTFTIHPRNPDILYFPQVPLLQSIDGGKSLLRIKGPHHGDHHDLWIDPRNPARMIDANDGGVDLTLNGGETWLSPPLPIAQFYHVACDNRTPYYVSGCMQDLGTASGPSNSLEKGGIRLGDWYPVGGGETGFTAPDPTNPDIVYAGQYGGIITRYDHRTRQAKNISVYPFNPSGHGADVLAYRFQWTAPLLLSPHDPKVLYHAANVLFRTENAGQKWTAISPDLTRNDRSKQKWSGGPITGDNTGVEVYGTIFALAESPIQKGLLWVGSDDGLVHVSRDGGAKWENVTANINGLPEWATVVCLEPSHFAAGTAYLVAEAHRLDDMRPYLFQTDDFGKTWRPLTTGLPPDVFLRVVREDPRKKGLLFLGSDRGVSFSTDAGLTWKPLKLNLPTVAVTDLVVKGDDLVVGTNGRSIWILDDLTPLREYSNAVAAQDVFLFPARPAIRYRLSEALEGDLQPGAGANPKPGVALHYFLRSKPKGEVVLEILDSKGTLVRTLTSKEEEDDGTDDEGYAEDKDKPDALPTGTGLHRVVWDLRYEGAKVIKRAKVDSGEPKKGPFVLPGTYTVRLQAGGKTLTTTVQVQLDPRQLQAAKQDKVDASFLADLEVQRDLLLKMRDDLNRLTRTVEQLRSVRDQLTARDKLIEDDPRAEALRKSTKAVLARLDALEERLHNPKARVTYDILAQKGGAQLYSQLAWLFDQLADSDGLPTQGIRTIYEEQVLLLNRYEQEWRALVAGDLTRLNEEAKAAGIPGILLPTVPK